MKRSVCVFALVMFCMGFVIYAGNEDAFFKGDFYGVSWGMTKDEVMRSFAGDVISEDALSRKSVEYLYRERGEIAYVDFVFYDDEDRLKRISVHVATNGFWRTTCTMDYIAWYTNRWVQKFGLWNEKRIREFTYTNMIGVLEQGVETDLRWNTPRMSVGVEIEVSTNTKHLKVWTSYYPRRKYLQ